MHACFQIPPCLRLDRTVMYAIVIQIAMYQRIDSHLWRHNRIQKFEKKRFIIEKFVFIIKKNP